MKDVRKLLGDAGCYEVVGAEGRMARHYQSIVHIRQTLRVATLTSELRYRRLSWLQDILQHPDDNVQLRAAVFWGTDP